MTNKATKQVKILDCTLRDGGYCNNWQFEKKLAGTVVNSLSNAGVDLIEIGYKSPQSHSSKSYEGLFRYCNESQLRFLTNYPDTEYAFMVDTKEFLIDNKVNIKAIDECIPSCNESIFTWARLATYYPGLHGTVELADVFCDLGYRTTINLMGTSLLNHKDLEKAFSLAATGNQDVLYFSDSFGDLRPNEVCQCINLIQQFYKGSIGIHTHDNNGLAFANTIAAIDAGIDFVDATIRGMGRGAGNLRLEQILLYSYFKMDNTNINPSELLEVIDSVFIPLQQKYKWGWDYTYMLSAMQNIHPTYCQHLRTSNQYNIEQVSAILNGIDPSQRETFNENALLKAIDSAVNEPLQMNEPLVELPLYKPPEESSFLVIATGPSTDTYRDELVAFIDQKSPVVIECNPKNTVFEDVSDRYLKAILNWVRLQKALDSPDLSKAPIITGLTKIPEKYQTHVNVCSFPCHISKGNTMLQKASMTLPAYVVGMFAVGLALLSRPSKVYLAGFDGYKDTHNSKHQEMNAFWKVTSLYPLVSITPTTYSLKIEPVYHLIK
ncbi:MAG: hypothetical protein JXQ82_09265 [Methanomicrobiaceae archaeon]|nr:hypothetical protein [Methanomicrobiaceae archaeon]